jgi:hypothetical protein
MKLIEPDERVAAMATSIGELAKRVRRSAPLALGRLGHWESEVESLNLLLLSANFALATTKLARSSLSFLPSAHLNARGAMEAGARALWMLKPDDPYEREGRWLAHFVSEISIRSRLGNISATEQENAVAAAAFAANVRAALPAGTLVPNSLPKFDKLLDAVGLPEKYVVYALLSQAAHATHYAAGLYRRHLGTEKSFGEFVAAEEWWLPLSIQWWFLAVPMEAFAECTGIAELRIPEELSQRFIKAQKSLDGR